MLGVCGVALIALGVFGGRTLENAQQTVVQFFEPETYVVETAQTGSGTQTDSQQIPATSELIIAEESDTQPTAVLASADEVQAEPEAAAAVSEVKASANAEPVLLKTAINEGQIEQADTSVELPKAAEVEQIVKTTAGSVTDNTLFALKDRVNLREGPSIDHAIVLQLDIGQELMEFKREGKWVHVGAYGTSGKIGWVHSSLVGKN
jgi:hypothetical protein